MSEQLNAPKKVILFAHEFPPIAGGHVMRALKFAKFLPEHGWHPIVITAVPDDCYYNDAWNRDPLLLNQLSSKTTIISVPSPLEKTTKSYVRKFHHKENISGHFKSKTIISRLRHFLFRIIKSIKKLYVWQDQVVMWLPYVYKVAREVIKKEKPNAFLTTTPPHLLQLLGLFLKYSTQLYWIADFRDGWTDNFLFQGQSSFRQWIDNWIESQVIKNADSIVVVNQHVKNSLQQRYPKYAHKINLIYNGVDISDFRGFDTSSNEVPGCVRYDHVGNWGGFRDPAPLVEAFKNLFDEGKLAKNEISVTFTGNSSEKERFFPDWVNVNPAVPHNSALKIMRDSNVLVLLTNINEQEGAFTSKVFEYLAAQRPILALIPPVGELADLLNTYSLGFVASPADNEQIKQAIINSFNCVKSQAAPEPRDKELVKQFERSHQSLQLAQLLDLSL